MNETMQELAKKHNTDPLLTGYVKFSFEAGRTPCSLLMGVPESPRESWFDGIVKAPRPANFRARDMIPIKQDEALSILMQVKARRTRR